MSVREAFNHGLEFIDELYKKAMEWEGEQRLKRITRLIELGLRRDEAEAWLISEPNFAKRTVTPLGNKQQGNRTAQRNTYMKLIFGSRVLTHSGGCKSCQ